jgi:RNA polymerase sigma-70 factor (ECF subfamily)
LPRELEESICKATVFERIYNTFAKDLHDYLYYKYGERFDPRDKTQEAFIKLWDNCKKVPINKVKSFLFTVATNMVLNDIKHDKVVLRYKQLSPKRYNNETPEFLLEKKQFLERYQNVLENLSEEQRTAFL